jgi:hypothetical protein
MRFPERGNAGKLGKRISIILYPFQTANQFNPAQRQGVYLELLEEV